MLLIYRLCTLCRSQYKERLLPCTTLTDFFYNHGGEGLLLGTDWVLICSRHSLSLKELLHMGTSCHIHGTSTFYEEPLWENWAFWKVCILSGVYELTLNATKNPIVYLSAGNILKIRWLIWEIQNVRPYTMAKSTVCIRFLHVVQREHWNEINTKPKYWILPNVLHSNIMFCSFAVYWVVSLCRFFTTHSLGRHYHTLPCNSVWYSAYKQTYNIIKMKLQMLFTVLR